MRLFFAIWPPAHQRDELARLARRLAHISRGRATEAANLHLTLAFLGEVDEALLPQLSALGVQLAALPAAPMALTRTGSWSNGIVWAAPEQTPAELLELVGQLNIGLAALGLPVEKRRYTPHLTLARRAHRLLAGHSIEPVPWPLDHLSLVASQLDGAGSRYTILGRWPLTVPTPVAPVRADSP